MTYELKEDAGGDLKNATFLCHASDLAYLPETEGIRRFREDFALNAKLFSVDNTQVYLAENEDHIVLAFRGTEAPTSIEGLKDWLLTDAMNLLMVPEGRLGHDLSSAGVGAKFHKGFADAIAEIWDPVSAAVVEENKRRDRPLWITGHSLGGALALYGAWLLKRKFVPVHQIYTFGAPMIGNRLACTAFDREFAGQVFRYINGKDPVPKLPALSLIANEYQHVEKQMLIGADPLTGLRDFLGDLGSKAAGGLLTGAIFDDVWQYINQQVSSHFLDAYRLLLVDRK